MIYLRVNSQVVEDVTVYTLNFMNETNSILIVSVNIIEHDNEYNINCLKSILKNSIYLNDFTFTYKLKINLPQFILKNIIQGQEMFECNDDFIEIVDDDKLTIQSKYILFEIELLDVDIINSLNEHNMFEYNNLLLRRINQGRQFMVSGIDIDYEFIVCLSNQNIIS